MPMFRWLNIVFFIGVLFINWAANALPLFGRTTGEVSAKYPVAITPASYAFSIWGLIYLLLAGYVLLQALPKWRDKPEILAIGPWFVISCSLNILWMLLWHSLQLTASVCVMIALLISLIVIYLKTRPAVQTGTLIRLLVALPFSIYLGWISVATVLNVTIGLSESGWNGFGLSDTVWAILLLIVTAILAFVISRSYRDPFYGAVIVWALVAIGVKQLDPEPVIAYAAWLLALLVLVYLLMLVSRNLQKEAS
ncbi:TspO/MBR family protein [Marinicrinis sediminis]|uniref:TspO/MBR family protein n=1 Tax=Marinicrinis sediminis TaxID=1652465 RepID=A0ABW5RDV5_9BACL